MENSIEIFQKTKIRVAIRPSSATPGYIPKENKNINLKHIYTPMFIAALFTIAKIRKQPKCPSTDEWIKKMWHIYTMEYYSAIKKKNEILPFATTWMDLEGIMLCEISQTEEDKYCMLLLVCGI